MPLNPIFLIVNENQSPDVEKLVSGSIDFMNRIEKIENVTNVWSIRLSGYKDHDVNFLSSLISAMASWGITPGEYRIETVPNK